MFPGLSANVLELSAALLMLAWAKRNGWKLPKGVRFASLESLEAYAPHLEALQDALRSWEAGLAKRKQHLALELARAWVAWAVFMGQNAPEDAPLENPGLPQTRRQTGKPVAGHLRFLRRQSRAFPALGVQCCVGWACYIS